jgi:hypothetical protein
MARKAKYIPLNSKDPRQWRCPHCFAEVGFRCQTIGGKQNLSFHEARRNLAKLHAAKKDEKITNDFLCSPI